MGYTTKFSGEFKLDRPLDDETYEQLAALDGPFYEGDGFPAQRENSRTKGLSSRRNRPLSRRSPRRQRPDRRDRRKHRSVLGRRRSQAFQLRRKDEVQMPHPGTTGRPLDRQVSEGFLRRRGLVFDGFRDRGRRMEQTARHHRREPCRLGGIDRHFCRAGNGQDLAGPDRTRPREKATPRPVARQGASSRGRNPRGQSSTNADRRGGEATEALF